MEKMEGIIMKNIQERAREYADRHKAEEIVGKVYGYERIYNAEISAYKRGALEQKLVDIDKAKSAFNKACGWLSTYTWYNEVVEEFRKVIEE